MKPYKILVVEDEIDISDLLKITLRDQNYAITFVDNGIDALMKLAEEIPDLVVLDILIPEPDGWKIYKKIRSNSNFDRTRVIILTALFLTPEFLKSKVIHRSDLVMTKPFDIEELITKVKDVLAEDNRRQR
jgi:DNA-binding response OmpR family regulator